MFELVNDVWGMKGGKKDRVKMNVGIKWSSFYCNDSLFLLFLNFVFLWTYDIFTYWRWQKVLTIVLCNCALRDGEPVRLETRMSLRVLKRYCYFNDVCSFVGLHCKSCVIMLGMENVNFFFFAAIRRMNFALLKNILPRTTQPPMQWVPGLPVGKAAGAWCWTLSPFLMLC